MNRIVFRRRVMAAIGGVLIDRVLFQEKDKSTFVGTGEQIISAITDAVVRVGEK